MHAGYGLRLSGATFSTPTTSTFTVPHELDPLGLTSRRPLLDLLFDASSQTPLEVARDPKRLGAEIGFLAILHTWSSNLLHHPHS